MNLWAAHFYHRICIKLYICKSSDLGYHYQLDIIGCIVEAYDCWKSSVFNCQCRGFHKWKLHRLYRHIYPVEGRIENVFDVTKEFHALLLKLFATASALAVIFVVDWRALSAPRLKGRGQLPPGSPFRRGESNIFTQRICMAAFAAVMHLGLYIRPVNIIQFVSTLNW